MFSLFLFTQYANDAGMMLFLCDDSEIITTSHDEDY